MGSDTGQCGSIMEVSWGVLTTSRLLSLGSICRLFVTGVQMKGEADGKHSDCGRYAETLA